jgi:hypothetical protein
MGAEDVHIGQMPAGLQPREGWHSSSRLQQIPAVPVKVREDGDRCIGLLARLFEKLHAARGHGLVVAPEIIGLQEQEDASARLMADLALLLLPDSFRQKQACPAGGAGLDDNPALSAAELVSSSTWKPSLPVNQAIASS